MIYLRRIKATDGETFFITHSETNKMALSLDAGQYKNLSFDETEIEFPISEFELNVCIFLVDDEEEPIVVVTGRNYTDPPDLENVILSICDFWIPPNCSDLNTIIIYSRCFDTEEETPFEGGEVKWEELG